MSKQVLLEGALAPVTGDWVSGGDSTETEGRRSVQVGVKANSPAFSAVVEFHGSVDGRFPILIATFEIDQDTDDHSEALEVNFRFEQFRARVVEVTGSATQVFVAMSV